VMMVVISILPYVAIALVLVAAGLFALRRAYEGRIARIEQELLTAKGDERPFSAEMVAGLPEPAQRYLSHAIAQGTPLAAMVELEMTGSIRGNGAEAPWMPLEAGEIIAPSRGFVWRAQAHAGGMALAGADYYFQRRGELRFHLFGLIPVVRAGGPATSLSALGRLIGEVIWCPSALLLMDDIDWQALDSERLRLTVKTDWDPQTLDLVLDPDGSLREVVVQRYDDGSRRPGQEYVPFGVEVDKERTFEGYTIPSDVRAGWLYGSEEYCETLRLTIHEAKFR